MDPYDKMMEWYDIWKIIPRTQQIDVAKKLAGDWDKRYHIVDAPTGVGKQFIALSMGYATGNAFVLTHTKQLQDQYIDGPGNCKDLRGRGNYNCYLNPTMNAANAPCITFKPLARKCAGRGICSYIEARKAAMAAPLMLTNYMYFMYAKNCGPLSDSPLRNLLIADEAHILENQLISFAETTLNADELDKEYNISPKMEWRFTGNRDDNEEIARDMYSEIQQKCFKTETAIEDAYLGAGLDIMTLTDAKIKSLPEKIKTKIQRLVGEHDKVDKLMKRLSIWVNTRSEMEWIVHNQNDDLIITPLEASGLFEPYINGAAHKFLFLSATIGSTQEFCRELGLDLSKANPVTTGTGFNPEASPVVHMGVGKFNYKEIDNTLPKAVKIIDRLLAAHPNDKGIIHSTSYKITNYVAKNSNSFGRLIHRDQGRWPLSNAKLVQEHEESKKATVLLSPSMNTGVSLDDELSRFQIIVKLPFMSLGDPRVKKKADVHGDWYMNKMWQEIMQAAGRSTRSDDDYCVTYILDESFAYFYRQWKHKLPSWFTERIVL